MRSLPYILAALTTLWLPSTASPQVPVALADSDLAVANVSYGADSSEVRRQLGAPATADSTVWQYRGLRVWFKAGKVRQIALDGRRFATRRGLHVGDSVARVVQLYGSSCTAGAFNYCRTVGPDPDKRGILVEVQGGVVAGIRVGAVFDLD